MLVVPLNATPSQSLHVLLGGQDCRINVYQKTTGLYADIYVSNVPLKIAQICRDRVPLVQHEYLGFVGDLFFKDTQGVNDPTYDGLGARYVLGYQTTI